MSPVPKTRREARGLGATDLTPVEDDLLVGCVADYDGKCSLCEQAILGYWGREPRRLQDEASAWAAFIRGDGPEPPGPAHPLDTLDEIVKADGTWVHVDCARAKGLHVA